MKYNVKKTQSQERKEKNFFALPNSNLFHFAKCAFLQAACGVKNAGGVEKRGDFWFKYNLKARVVKMQTARLEKRERALLAKAFIFICARAMAARESVFQVKSKEFLNFAGAKGGVRPARVLTAAAAFLAALKITPEGEMPAALFAGAKKIWGGVEIRLNEKDKWNNPRSKKPQGIPAFFFANKIELPTELFTLNALAFKGALAIIRQARLKQKSLGVADFLRDSGGEEKAVARRHEGRVRVRVLKSLQAVAAVLERAGLQVAAPVEKGRAFLKSRVGLILRPQIVETPLKAARRVFQVVDVGKHNRTPNRPTVAVSVPFAGGFFTNYLTPDGAGLLFAGGGG